MAQYGGGQMQQGFGQSLCDYCHLKPAFPPYNYCSKTCGSRAKANGRATANTPALCKQCGQRPVYKGHQFCGRNCANTWQAMYGQNNTTHHGNAHGQPQQGQTWNPMPPPQMQNHPTNPTPPFQGFNQGGGGGGVGVGGAFKGIAKSIGGLVARNQQPQPSQQFQPPQQQFGAVSPPYQQQIQGSLSPNHSVISPPISPMTSGMGSPMMSTPTTSNQQYSDPPSPESSDEFDDFYDPNDDFQTNGHRPQLLGPHVPSQSSMLGQRSNAMNIAMNSSANSINGNPPDYDPTYDPFADPNQVQAVSTNPFRGQGQNAGGSGPIQAQAHAQFTVQVTSPPAGAGGHGNGYWDPNDPNNFPSQQQLTSPSPGSSMTCRLSGCNKPVFVDPATYQPSEYCSQRHREEATIYGQADPCIMCRKMPRSPTDHFCSRACRDKALSP